MASGWLGEAQTDLASDRILDAAGRAFVEVGVSRANMADIARRAGCSRGTVYRYFKTRHDLHVAFVNRAAVLVSARVAARIASIDDAAARLVETIVESVREVRATPETAAWFAPDDVGMGTGAARGSEMVDALARAFVQRLVGAGDDPDARLRARWLVRVIVSLLTVPGEDDAEERALIERFVAPTIVAD